MIKSFLYLDEYKLYSFSAQIMKGVTEYIDEYSSKTKSDMETQKGPIDSGRVLADIANRKEGTVERKFLFDHAFNLFENEISNDDLVIAIDEEFGYDPSIEFKGRFVKIRSQATFTDLPRVLEFLNSYNKIGKALACVSNYEAVQSNKEQAQLEIRKTKDRNKKKIMERQIKKISDFGRIAKESGLYLDDEFVDGLSVLLRMFGDYLEISLDIPGQHEDEEYVFSALLTRDFLRETEDLLIKKYSRCTEVPITLFGLATQALDVEEEYDDEDEECHDDSIESSGKPTVIKEALPKLVNGIADIERTLFGKRKKEIIIDPIAVFWEL